MGVAGRLTGIYPAAVPGGWNLIGRATLCLFDPQADPPSLIRAGDRVRFVPVDRLDEPPPRRGPRPARRPRPLSRSSSPASSPPCRTGAARVYRRYGVSGSGPLDREAHAAANRAVGNAPAAAALECTLVGPTLRFLRTTAFAVTGADLGARLERDDLGSWPVPAGVRVVARAGNVLSFEGRRSGCRAYVAFAGGLDVPPVLGARSTDLLDGFGGFAGRALAAGDSSPGPSRPAGGPRAGPTRDPGAPDPVAGHEAVVDVVLGPQDDCFGGRDHRTSCSPRPGRCARAPTAPAVASKDRDSRIAARPRSRATAWCPAASRCPPTASPSSCSRTGPPPAATRRSRPS